MRPQAEHERGSASDRVEEQELETFFDDVMVMVDDPSVRANRMSLLRKIGNTVLRIADVTKIVVDRSEYRS